MGISLDWLILGRQKTDRINADDADNLAGNSRPSQMAATVEIPVYDVKASAGPGTANGPGSVVGHVPVPRAWLYRLHCPLNSLQAIEAKGDSMEPDIHDGDVLLVDTSVRTVERSGLYVLRYADHLRVKYLQRRADDGIIIRSAAPQEVDETVPRDRLGEIAIIGRVVWTGRRI
ncbi:MAG: helix-turn-helix transcriptional regulator [Alphaproteobacteria bacterium]|nr:MAG: helix-turn-helix transcriptional regulator [Alphaproteobacteria bacterium]